MKVFPIKFDVSTRDYVRLFYHNLLLNICTLGLYSAWSNIRSRQFFSSHIRINDSSFRFDAEPVKLMNYRLIMFTLIVTLIAGEFYSRSLALALVLALIFVFPELVNYYLSHKIHHTSFRNIRFSFKPDYREALIVYGVLLLSVPLSLGLSYPYYVHRRNQYVYNHISYGKTRFRFNSYLKDYCELYAHVFLNIIFGIALLLFATKAILVISGSHTISNLAGFLIISIFLVYNWSYLLAHKFNYDIEGIEIDGIRFQSDLDFKKMLSLMTANYCMVICSLGLLYPVARMRLLRYRLSMLSFCINNQWQEYQAQTDEQKQTVKQRVLALVGIDIG